MPADIRSFFGPKGGSQPSSQEKATAKTAPKADANAAKKKSRGSRRVVDDSDDEAPAPTKSTPKKAAPKKPVKQESPKGTETTTSDYFASSGKAKPARSNTKAKSQPAKAATPEPTELTVKKESPIAKTKKESPAKNTRSARSTANKPSISYKEHTDDDGAFQDDEDPDDVFKAEFKSRGKGLGDDYEEGDEDEDEEDVKPTRRSAGRGKQTTINKAEMPDEDLDMKDVNPDDDFVVPDADEAIVEDKPARSSRSAGKASKRKSANAKEDDDSDDQDEDEYAPVNKKRKVAEKTDRSPAKKPAAKKPRASAVKNEEAVEDSTVQKIFDSIPTVRPPSPPAKSGEAKKYNYFEHAQSRGQPAPAAGTKEIPIGAENCLTGLVFVFTGLLESLGRDEGQELVKRYGGKVTMSPSSKTSYVVLGSDAGPKKLETIKKHNLKTINEDGLFELIRRLPANGGDSKAAEKSEERRRKEEEKIREMAAEMEQQERKTGGAGGVRESTAPKTTPAKSGGAGTTPASSQKAQVDSRLWTVKYAPQSMQQICGNKGQVERLGRWLKKWHYNAKFNFKKPGPDGSGLYRAVIISGPPGIGKTTAAHLAARLEGYDVVESNASDTRSKKLVENGLRGVLDTSSLLGYFAGEGQKVEASKRKLVLIMDEVDGMSAGDRGGVGALASVCKKTNIPMILICNERKIPKMKPFDYVTLDMPFRRPTVQDIRSRVMTICFREGMKMPGPVVDALIEGSHSDIRQIINMLSTAKLDQEAMDFDQGKAMSKAWQKHVILKPWDITAKLLGGHLWAPNSGSTLNEKIELYFNDHEFSYLMLQENYPKTTPTLTNNYSGKEKNLKHLELLDKAAESISDGDLVDRLIHGPQQQWSLMPTHAVFSTVRPASFVSGGLAGHGGINFTSWLGNNSKQGKLSRFIKEIQGHMRLRAHGDRHEIRQQYLPTLWDQLIRRLQEEGKESIQDIIELMDSYFLTKEDWDAILELGLGPMDQDKVKIETQTKSAFTRAYNAASHPLPFMKASSVVAPKKMTKEKPDLEEALEESDEGEEILSDNEVKQDNDDEEELDLSKDKYVKMPKKKKGAASTATAGGSKKKAAAGGSTTTGSKSKKASSAVGGAGAGSAKKTSAAKGKKKTAKKDYYDDDDDDEVEDEEDEDEDEDDFVVDDDDEDEEVKPKRGRGSKIKSKPPSSGSGRGRARK